MFGSQVLEIGIGIVLVYLLFSLICSALNELISRAFSMRAKNLEQGIRNLLNDPQSSGLAKQFYAHPLIRGLTREGGRPSYIPARTFSLALMDIICPADPASGSRLFKDVRDKLTSFPDARIKGALLALVDDAESDLKKARQNVETWYNDAMDRVSGWYKRKAQVIILALALGVCIFANADTIMIAKNLSSDSTLRAAVVAAAEEAARRPPSSPQGTPLEQIQEIRQELNQLQLPIGWTLASGDPREVPRSFRAGVLKVFGLLFTAIAVSLGAPFWFDVLNKLVNLRSAGKQPEGAEKK